MSTERKRAGMDRGSGGRTDAGHTGAGEGYSIEVVELPIEDSLDLHHFRPSEVKNLVEDYLDEARNVGFREVRIIHGKGRGVLREIVHSILKKHPGVVSFQLADQRSGGWGATVAVLDVAAGRRSARGRSSGEAAVGDPVTTHRRRSPVAVFFRLLLTIVVGTALWLLFHSFLLPRWFG